MMDAPVPLPTWTRQRWCLAIASVLAAQAALIFLLERTATGGRHKSVGVPLVHLRTDISLEKFVVNDPSVFVLPHHHGFSGEAWLNHLPVLNFQPVDWAEPPHALPFIPGLLSGDFKAFVAANPGAQFETLATLEPARTVPSLFPIETAPAKSTLRIEGPLAQRRMLAPPSLRVWESADLLADSLVQVLVDAQGRTISAVLLSPGVRLNKQVDADANALALAKAAQFEPVETGALTVGTLTFEWQTLPPPATNAPVEIQ